MKNLILLFTILTSNAFAVTHFGPEGTRLNKIEIFRIEKSLKDKLSNKEAITPEERAELQNLQTLLTVGKRAVQWFEKVNSSRSAENKMDLTARGEAKGTKITQPNKTNTKILVDNYTKMMTELPALMTSVVTSSNDLPSQAPIADADFVKAIRTLDKMYQNTVRWVGSKDYLDWYAARSATDVRGYYFLKAIPDLDQKLNSWTTLNSDDQNNYTTWLMQLCHNGVSDLKSCQKELNEAILQNHVFSFYQKYNPAGEIIYKSFFQIKNLLFIY